MGRIRVLSPDMVSFISAGEVIDGPWSIVKELVENSLDAAATHIDIEIRGGGIDSVVVSDNGHGIAHDDVPMCVRGHSTSKVRNREDLDTIATYGFRGEALASIAAVADLHILTRTADEEMGSKLVSRVGEAPKITNASRPNGTTVEVTHLFARIPARKKQLGTPKTEGQRVVDVVMRHAMPRFDVGFRLVKDGEVIIDCPPEQSPRDRAVAAWGAEVAPHLAEVYFTKDSITIKGFLARPLVTRGTRAREYLSVHKRPVEDMRLSTAVESAYSTLLMRGRYPVCVLDISLDPLRVDVNVHPTKREVRIKDAEEVASAVRESVRRVLLEPQPSTFGQGPEDILAGPSLEPFLMEEESEKPSSLSSSANRQPTTDAFRLVEGVSLEGVTSETSDDIIRVPTLGGTFRIVGQVHNLYVVLELQEGLLIIDQHAAHERVMYERLRRQMNSGAMPVQELLEPIVLRLQHTDAENVLGLSDVLERMGYSVSGFGGNEILVTTLPDVLGYQVSEKEVTSIVDEILAIGVDHASEHFMDEIVKITACHSAIRAGQPMSKDEIRNLLVAMASTPNRYSCPHGRPTILRISVQELEKKFGRIGH
ncbi:MAG: hypothetical protein C4K49_05970 [Candidatus Thorarchaeota archaeon]|nr:MAG: hypothetical protein C4K49_05970 [Candidatus Thorarchaeota archaeon]